MERYRKTLNIRRGWMSAGILAAAGLLLVRMLYAQPHELSDEYFSGVLVGVQSGLLEGLMVVLVVAVIKITRALADEDKLRIMYNKETDERMSMIRAKSGGYPMLVCSLLIFLAAVVGGYFHPMVFYSLLGCTYFLLLAQIGLKVYYTRKY